MSLSLCIRLNDLSSAEYMLSRGTKQMEYCGLGHNEFTIAAESNNDRMIKLLKAYGFDINKKSIWSHMTPLMYAVTVKPFNITHVQLLIQNGADPNIRDKEGRHALLYATDEYRHATDKKEKTKYYELIKYLIINKSNCNWRDHVKFNIEVMCICHRIAVRQGQAEVDKFAKSIAMTAHEANALMNICGPHEIEFDNTEMIILIVAMIDNGANVFLMNRFNQNAKMMMERHNEAIAKFIYDYGCMIQSNARFESKLEAIMKIHNINIGKFMHEYTIMDNSMFVPQSRFVSGYRQAISVYDA